MKTYVDFDPQAGYPRSADLYYECQECDTIVPSMPSDNCHCRCFNVRIDVEAGRMAVRDRSHVRLVRMDSEECSP
jgi:hypothetical protein